MRKEFEKYGTVKSARIITNRFNHKSKGFVRGDAQPARGRDGDQGAHDKDVLGRKLRVNEAKNKSRE